MDFEVLFSFRAPRGSKCPDFDQFVLVTEDMTIGDMIVAAQDALNDRLTSGQLHNSTFGYKPGSFDYVSCSAASYVIDFGPTMGE